MMSKGTGRARGLQRTRRCSRPIIGKFCAKDERRLRARVCRADASRGSGGGVRDFSPPTAPPSRTAHSTSFLLLRPPLDPSPSVPFILHSSFASQRSLTVSLSLFLYLYPFSSSFSLSPVHPPIPGYLLLRPPLYPRWRTSATYAADTPLDTSCTILDLLISHPECTDTRMRSAHRTIRRRHACQCLLLPVRVCNPPACTFTHAIHKGPGGPRCS